MESLDTILARHRKENRELVAKITGLKKQATKSTKKDIQKKCEELERELKAKHETELKEHDEESTTSSNAVNDGSTTDEIKDKDEDHEITPEKLLAQLELSQKEEEETNSTPLEAVQRQKKGPKRNRQKERLAKRQAALEEQKKQAQEEAALQPNLKQIEAENIAELCKLSNLEEFDIKPDGNCLFASISDQLKIRQEINVTTQELRSKAANHIRNDPETFTPYLFDEETMTLKNIDEYTDKIENTAAWGSDLEILALAKEYDSPVSILMSGRATLKMNESGMNPELKLVYYKHTYALGEHYNSLRDAQRTFQ